MSIDDYVEAFARGEQPEVPPEMQAEVSRAVAGLGAIRLAIGDTTIRAEQPADDRKAPELPGDYQIVRELGRGGMGVVYLAKQRSLDRLVAVKVLRPGEIAFGPIVRRFVEEARHLAKLRHPNIVAIHETGQAGSEPYFTMDYVQGETLSAEIKRGPLTPARAVGLLAQACAGVDHAHHQGIVHRDLKPGNILVDANGRAYVTDFGLARDLSRDSSLTGSGDIVGTPAYMSPEQANGETAKIGERTDVYALGVILYEALTGQSPYGHGSPMQVLARLLRDEPTPPRKANPNVPRDLETICLTAMEKEPERRYATVHALLEDLRRFEKGEPVMARRPGRLGRARRFILRHRTVIGVAATLAVVLYAVGPLLFDRSLDELIHTAQEQEAAGDHLAAVEMLVKARGKARSGRVEEITGLAVQCASDLGDTPQGVKAWFEIADWGPRETATRYDLLIGKTVYRQLSLPGKDLHCAEGRERGVRLLFAHRSLDRFLHASFGTPAEREEASNLLAQVEREQALNKRAEAALEDASILPEGTLEELEKKAEDPKLGSWERGKAAYAAGLALSESKDPAGALAQLRKGFELMRQVYPTYDRRRCDGVIQKECGLLKSAWSAVHSLDPSAPAPLTGGIRLHVDRNGLATGENIELSVQIEDVDRPAGPKWDKPEPESLASVDKNDACWLGVADGRYRVMVRSCVSGADFDFTRPMDAKFCAMQCDCDALPQVVEVRGNTVEVPAVRLWRRHEIRILSPQAGAVIDLQHETFRWTPVAGAVRYQVSIAVLLSREAHETSWEGITSEDTTSTELCLGTLPGEKTEDVRKRLVAGKTGEIEVEAYDASGKWIGSLASDSTSGTFVVGREIEGK